MLFRVTDKVKGSITIKGINSPKLPGQCFEIPYNSLYLDSIRGAYQRGKIELVDKDIPKQLIEENKVLIKNNLPRPIIINNRRIGSNATIVVSREFSEVSNVIEASSLGYIDVIKNDLIEDFFIEEDEEEEIKDSENEKISEVKESQDEKIKEDNLKIENKDTEKEKKSYSWDFKKQSLKEAESTPETKSIKIDGDEDNKEKNDKKEDDVKDEKVKKTEEKNVKNKKTVNKTVNKKNKTKEKTINPVGDKKEAKNSFEADIELDSRGKPRSKVSDVFQHIIDDYAGKDNDQNSIDFVDKEQKQEKLKNKRNKSNKDSESDSDDLGNNFFDF